MSLVWLKIGKNARMARMDIGALAIQLCLFLALYFEVFLLIAFFEKKPAEKTSARPRRFPSVTMVVPCFNEERTLTKTVESLLALNYPKDKLSILIVDDGSTDTTRSLGEALAATHPQVMYAYKTNGGKYTALNFAIARAQTELIGCLDADSFVVEDSLIEIIKKFESDPSIMAITPAMKVYEPKNILERMQSVEYTFGIFYKKMFDNLAALNVLPGPFSIYRKEVFEQIGLFRHAHNAEDMEIAFRMHANGLKIVNAHTALVYTTVPKGLRALLKQRTRWSQGFLQNSQDYSFMYLNRRFGNFGLFVLPFGLAGFAAGLFTALYALYRFTTHAGGKMLDWWFTGVPLQLPDYRHIELLYLNTSMTLFLVLAAFSMIVFAILMGSRMAHTKLPLSSLISYFALYGLIAPLWLARALVGAALAQESKWR